MRFLFNNFCQSRSLFLLLILLGMVVTAFVTKASTFSFDEKPFWRVKPKPFAKITEDREIVVLVKTENEKAEVKTLKMDGGGALKRSASEVFADVQKYSNLKQVSERIVEVSYDSAKNELFVHCEAFQYHARMWMSVHPETVNNERRLNFKVLRGHFVGMQGAFTFEEFKPQMTLMGFRAVFDYKTLPMPRFFVEFGLEVVLQKVAKDMRTFLEKTPSL